MYTISAALIWGYWARNRWNLLWPVLCANLPWLLALFLLDGVDISTNEPLNISLKATLTLAAILIICLGVIFNQMNITHLYVKPISTIDIVNFFGLAGGVLVGCQVVLILSLWRWLIGGEVPVAGPAFFSLVCWGALLSVYLVPTDSARWIIGFFVVLFGLGFWYFSAYGLRIGPGGAMAASVHHWSTISGVDVLVGLTVLAVSYVITLRRVANHRNGIPHNSLLKRASNYWWRIESQRQLPHPTFVTPDKALEWFDRKARTHDNVLDLLIFMFSVWLIALVVAAISSPLVGIRFALVGTLLIIGLKINYFILMASRLRGYQGEFGRDLKKSSTNLSGFYTRMFFNTLPITPARMSSALIQSSAKTAGLFGCLTLGSLFALGGLAWLVGLDPNDLFSTDSVRTSFARVSLCITLGLMFFAFIGINYPFTISPTGKYLIVEYGIMIGAILGVLVAPKSLVLCTVALLLVSLLAYSSLHCLRRSDQSLIATILIWFIGIVSVPILASIFSRDFSATAISIATLLVALAMFPFFSMPAALRKIRTN